MSNLPILPKRPTATTPNEQRVASEVSAYRGRGHLVGTFAFGAEADLETVSSLVSAFVRAFCPPTGLAVRASRGARTEVLPSRFSPTASISATQLARGGSVELTAGGFDEVRASLPLFWVASQPAMAIEDDVIALRFGCCFVRPGADKPEGAIAHAVNAMVEAAVEVKGCLSAIATAQDAPMTLAKRTLPYEVLAGTQENANDALWLRSHVRAPGWRVLVPKSKIKSLSRPPPDGVTLERVASGLLVKVDTPTPFTMAATGDLEQWLLPLFS
jgi:hypothetical protein